MYRSDERICRTRIKSSVVKVLHSRYTCEKARGRGCSTRCLQITSNAWPPRDDDGVADCVRWLDTCAGERSRGENKVNRRIWQRRFQLLACQLLSQRETRCSHFSTRQRAHTHTHACVCDKRIKPCEQSSPVIGLPELNVSDERNEPLLIRSTVTELK